MELLFKKNIIGFINNIYKEGYWVNGFFEKTDEFRYYADFFNELVYEDGFDESKIEFDLFNDDNWYVNENGIKVGIYIPAIYEDGDISFRYR